MYLQIIYGSSVAEDNDKRVLNAYGELFLHRGLFLKAFSYDLFDSRFQQVENGDALENTPRIMTCYCLTGGSPLCLCAASCALQCAELHSAGSDVAGAHRSEHLR